MNGSLLRAMLSGLGVPTTKGGDGGAGSVLVGAGNGVYEVQGDETKTSVATTDELWIKDATDGTFSRITTENLLKVINGLTADSAPDPAADYVATYDDSASSAKKVLISDLPGIWTQLATATISSSTATQDFDSVFDDTYRVYMAVAWLRPVNDNVALYARVAVAGTPSTYITSGYSVRAASINATPAWIFTASGSTSVLSLTQDGAAIGNAADEGVLSITFFRRPRDSANGYFQCFALAGIANNAALPSPGIAQSHYNTGGANVVSLRYLFSAGNIAVGQFQVFGLEGS